MDLGGWGAFKIAIKCTGTRNRSKRWTEKQLKLNRLVSIIFVLGVQGTPARRRSNDEFSTGLWLLAQGFAPRHDLGPDDSVLGCGGFLCTVGH